ncbi:cation:proton antiporter [Mucilaginibacter sp. RS28]|uniref:Cation:proton antiporter n=1 Tax=Mucilaginibacter straminoryzae TaxID=2932774 RepID=A0A9X1X2J6_9SPHI|nr:cation:proton antiporter [Mucilaginibacter straminoryzae]MCJ8209150.1 cation:proton antiporter [Mucilaginibacter straminoryzae]
MAALQLPLSNPVAIFLLVLLIILIAPRLVRMLGLPDIVGFILSGIAIGPYGLNLLQKNAAIDLLATIGLLYIMFIAGLQLNLKEFQQKKNRGLFFGVMTFAIPIALGFPVCYYLLHLPLLATILTTSMFATHTLVAYPIVSKYQVTGNEAVSVAVSGTILTDTAVLVIFSAILAAQHGQFNLPFILRLVISAAVFGLIMFLVIPKLAAYFFKKFAGEDGMQYIFVLSIVFAAALLSQLAGLEPIIGAFVAGLTLNRFVPAIATAMERVQFTGTVLFIPFFLISVGMLVDLRILFKGPAALFAAASLTITALLGKWLAAWITQKTFAYTPLQRRLLFGLSSSHAAATMAIILVGYKAGIVDENVLNGTILLIVVTCMVASFATENAAKKLTAAATVKTA